MTTTGRAGSTTARSALKILGLFSAERPTLGVTEISRELALPKSNVARLITALEQEGFLTRTPERRYQLGLRLHYLGQIVAHSHVVYEASLEALSEVRTLTGESTHLAVLNNLEVVHLDRLRSTYLVKITGPRYRSAVHATGTGKTLLAFAPVETQEAVIEAGLAPLTSRTITDPKRFREELQTIRRLGYGFDFGEFIDELSCVTVPIMDAGGNAAAVMSVVAWTDRLAEPRRTTVLNVLQRVAAKISLAIPARA